MDDIEILPKSLPSVLFDVQKSCDYPQAIRITLFL